MRMRYTGIVVFLAVVVALVFLMAHNPGYTEDQDNPDKPGEADAVTMATAPPPGAEYDMAAAIEFFKKNQYGFLATVDNGRPRVRAFSILKIEGDTLYFGTSNDRAVFVQLKENLLAEWVSMDPKTYTTVRAMGEVVFIDDMEIKRAAIASSPMLKEMYAGEKAKEFEMFYMPKPEISWFIIPEEDEEAEEKKDE
jgi:uncharacterized pyridoxamine 5'-phosphate oxidase family protein